MLPPPPAPRRQYYNSRHSTEYYSRHRDRHHDPENHSNHPHLYAHSPRPLHRAPALPRSFPASAFDHLSAPAVVCGGRTTSYRDLLAHAARLAREFRKRLPRVDAEKQGRAEAEARTELQQLEGEAAEAAEGPRIAIFGRPGTDYVAAMWAAWAAGGVAVPLCESYPPEELLYVLKDSGACLVVGPESSRPVLAPLAAEVAAAFVPSDPLEGKELEERDADEEKAGIEALKNVPFSHAAALIVYTSGTTGRPKGVVHSHIGLASQAGMLVDAWDFSPSDRVLNVLPLHHIRPHAPFHPLFLLPHRLHCPCPFSTCLILLYPFSTCAAAAPYPPIHTSPCSSLPATHHLPCPFPYTSQQGSHVHGIMNALLSPLSAGATVEFFPSHRFSAAAVWQRWRESYPDGRCAQPDSITFFTGVPTHYMRLLQEFDRMPLQLQRKSALAASKLRLMMSGSAACPDELMRRWHQVTGQRLLERYGMTEFAMALTNPLLGEKKSGSVGVPLRGVKVKLADTAKDRHSSSRSSSSTGTARAMLGHLSAPGAFSSSGSTGSSSGGRSSVVSSSGSSSNGGTWSGGWGELLVKSPGMFLRYWNRPQETAEAFDPQGWFRTGDIASVDSHGYWQIHGRASVDIIKTRGFKVSALEIESKLLEHPLISEAAVLGVPERQQGEAVAAVVVLGAAQQQHQQQGVTGESVAYTCENACPVITLDELRKWAAPRMAHYKAIPCISPAFPPNRPGAISPESRCHHASQRHGEGETATGA
ncbi:unnamed protein product [Closterium sp. Naga37s-1]|nr:unnamed protein product [Closterium sp. Naga37s-1]